MNEDIIRMAREAGWSGLFMTYNEPTGKADWQMVKERLTVPVTMEQIERFAALVAADEREACAKVCDDEALRCEAAVQRAEPDEVSAIRSTAWKISVCAATIRARGQL